MASDLHFVQQVLGIEGHVFRDIDQGDPRLHHAYTSQDHSKHHLEGQGVPQVQGLWIGQ